MKTRFFLSAVISLIFFGSVACGSKNDDNLRDNIPKLAAPLQLDYERTLIHLDDFLPDTLDADSVIILGKKIDFYQNKKTILFEPENIDSLPAIMEMKIWAKGVSSSIILKKSRKKSFLFLFDAKGKSYKNVQIAGEFNGWVPSKTNLTFDNGLWGIMLLLNEGNYQYQLVLDGKWQLDADCKNKVDNNQGGFNSLLTIGEMTDKNPKLIAENYTDKITISYINKIDEIFVLWNNKRLDTTYYSIDSKHITINIPANSKNIKRSFIRVFSYNNYGQSNDLLIPLENGKVITDAKLLNRSDFQSNIIYNVFVDRFFDANPNNNWRLPDSLVLWPANYQGGDIEGITKKIKDGYFNQLGVNTLWISPIVKNTEGAYGIWPKPKTLFSAYHGYWPTSFTQIDRHFGDDKTFRQMVNTAHENNENVLLDYVANHVHLEHPYYIANPQCATNLVLPNGSLNLEKWDEYRLTTWFDKFLPTLNLGKTEIANMLSDSIVWWARNYQLDGFRYDAAKHVPLSFWRILTKKLKEQDEKASQGKLYQLGETYGSPELISSYVSNGLLDAQFDFNVYDAALQAFAAGGNFQNLSNRLHESISYYGSHNLMGYITGNQDRGRFISYAGGSLKFDEDAKAAGWSRKIDVGNPEGYKKLQMLMAFNMTIPGNPVIYYGDEFGMPGGNDPDCRRMMRFGNELSAEENNNLNITSQLCKLRNENMALNYGDFCYFSYLNNNLVYARRYFNNIVITAFNNSKVSNTVKIDLSQFSDKYNFTIVFKHKYSISKNFLTLELPPNSFEIFIKN